MKIEGGSSCYKIAFIQKIFVEKFKNEYSEKLFGDIIFNVRFNVFYIEKTDIMNQLLERTPMS